MQKEEQWLLKEKYQGKPCKNFYKDIKRLEKGEPLDYVIGFAEFLGCKIDLSKKPLIPRPETEFWVKQAIDEIKKSKIKRTKVLDIFSGSGCVGIAVLANTQKVLCDFADSQNKCLKQTEINCQINKISKKRYKIIKSDVFSNIKNKYDFVLANPPYIPTTRKNKVGKSVLEYEPKQALFGGKDGLLYIKKFLSLAKKYLNPNGKIFMEFDYIQKKRIEKLLKQYGFNSPAGGWQFYKDQYGKYRWVVIS